MILLFVNAFKDITKDRNFPFLNHNARTILDNKLERRNVILLKNVLYQKKNPKALEKILFLVKQTKSFQREPVAPFVFLTKTLATLRPLISFKFKKVAGVRHRLPIPNTLRSTRDQFQAAAWLIDSANKRSFKKHFVLKLKDEILDCSKRRGLAYRTRNAYHKFGLTQRPSLKFL